MNKRRLLYVIFGLVFYLLFLVVEMPASWFAWGLNHFTNGAVRLESIVGSVWSGNGRLVIYYPQTSPHDMGSAQWRINPLWLVSGRLQTHWRVESADTNLRTTLRFGQGQTQLIEMQANMSAQTVGDFYPPASLVSPQGQVLVRSDKLVFNRDGIEGSVEISWQNAGSGLSTVRPLGDYRLDIAGAGQTASLKLNTLKGDLELTGQGQWQAQTRQIQFSGFASPREHAAELDPLLKLFGEDRGDGRRSFSFTSRLAAP